MVRQTYSKGKLWFRFIVYSCANLLTYSAFGSLLGLQSSLNVVDSVGTKTTALLFGSSVISAVVLLPLLLRSVSPRKCLIASQITYALYTVANVYPKNYLLIPTAILVGVGDAILWTTMPIYLSFFAKEYEKSANSDKEEISTFSGYFFAIFQLSKIVGNSVNYVVLHAFATDQTHSNSSSVKHRNISFCGANDCQDPSQIQDNLSSYVPNRTATYIILGMMVAMYMTALLLFALFLPQTKVSRIEYLGAKRDNSILNKMERQFLFVTTTMKDTLRQILSLKQILLMPGIFYGGFDFGFLTSELTRAYTSCVFGVSWVAIHLMVFGISACIFSTLCGKLSKYIPALGFIFFAAITDAVAYTYYLFWKPDSTTQWYVIPAYILAGGMQGIWKPQSIAIQARTFYKTIDVGSAVWLFWWTLGICVEFAISPLLCVRVKIFMQLILLAISVAGYVSVEIITRRTPSETNEISSKTEETILNPNEKDELSNEDAECSVESNSEARQHLTN